MNEPIAIDLYCGLGGWTEGLLAEGYFVVGFDIERHVYGDEQYPGELALQDVRTLHGSQFRDAALIVASPPCQAYSYRAMPWKRAKALPPPDNELFDACFRIQREACDAAGHHVPMVVENVRGAQKWVGRSRWNFGSFHLWGDVPALMPMNATFKVRGDWFGADDAWQKLRGSKFIGNNNWLNRSNSSPMRRAWSDSDGRRAASAMIAKIPEPLARWIGRVYYPGRP